MNHHRDFEELLAALSNEKAEALIVGAYAVMASTEPRYTKDLDVWVRPTLANARRVYRALKKFGAGLKNLEISDLAKEGIIFQIGVEPVRIDIITQLDGLEFGAASKRAVLGKYGKVTVAFLSVPDLIQNKTLVARPQDLLDVAKLNALLPETKKAAKKPRQKRRAR